MNPDVVGWIQIEGTQIDYPILYDGEDNEKYLHTDIEGNDSVSGAIYLMRMMLQILRLYIM